MSQFPAQPPKSHAARRSSGSMAAVGMEREDNLAQAEARAVRTLATASRVVGWHGGVAELFVSGEGATLALEARGAALAAIGALERRQFAPVRATLSALFAHQRPSGQLPDRLACRRGVVGRILNFFGREVDGEPLATATFAPAGPRATESSALTLWLAAEYVTKSGDLGFWEQFKGAIGTALTYLQEATGACLVGGALRHLAFRAMGDLAVVAGDAVAAARYWAAAAAAREAIPASAWEEAAPEDLAWACAMGAGDRTCARTLVARLEAGPMTCDWMALAAARLGDLTTARRWLDEVAHRLGTDGAAGYDDALAAGPFLRTLAVVRG